MTETISRGRLRPLWVVFLRTEPQGCSLYQKQTTLMDIIKGRVYVEAKVGHETIFTIEEEKKLYDQVTYMAEIGFG
ncbi:hypothetical protein DPMN_128266 [Dreissena polymorpha]|uniref:Uncharacterized protein n=1 Tax=Dreissena polymorpha TaxID=45954 RepID=A0A9D4H3K0_DREPO|nr:hypothetical protein DPMN_128266 [Dreissena polymorpha]